MNEPSPESTHAKESEGDPRYPHKLRDREDELRKTRWGVARSAKDDPEDFRKKPTVGLALSGGGIRSATISLGFLQGMAAQGRLRYVDFLSTVSGGGYIGAWLGAQYSRLGHQQSPDIGAAVATELATASDAQSWLRENGCYLAPNGSGDLWAATAMMIRNLLSLNAVLILPLLVLIFIGLGLSQCCAGFLPISPWSAAALAVALLWLVPTWIAYWMCSGIPSVVVLALGSIACGTFCSWGHDLNQAAGWGIPLSSCASWAGILSWLLAGAAVVLVCAGVFAFCAWLKCGTTTNTRSHGMQIRRTLTEWAAQAQMVFAVLLILAGVHAAADKLDEVLAAHDGVLGTLVALGTGGFGVWGLNRWVGRLATRATRLPLPALATLGGLLVLTVVVLAVDLLARRLIDVGHWDTNRYVICLGIATALTLALGQWPWFLNQVGLRSLYGARLIRAFIGASNPERKPGSTKNPDGDKVTYPLPGDDLAWGFEIVPTLSGPDYAPWRYGGPLHLINVTLNETVDGKSALEQNDRKGMNFAIGPVGISVGCRHHASWSRSPEGGTGLQSLASPTDFAVFPQSEGLFSCDTPTVGWWVTTSGAAVSTGLGSRSNLGLSILCCLCNVRLGCWWDSGIVPGIRKAGRAPGWLTATLPMYSLLLDEMRAAFHGPSGRRHWYLSDGGHFENCAVYELIRRRVALIILCDNGQDLKGASDDVTELVRKAAIDFDTRIEFMDAQDLCGLDPMVRQAFGSLADLDRDQQGLSRAHAALAHVHYPATGDDPAKIGLLMLVKPTVTGDERLDVLGYQRAHGDFPHQSTADQFFDEAQWESYRALGEHIAQHLFRQSATDSGWTPWHMQPWPGYAGTAIM